MRFKLSVLVLVLALLLPGAAVQGEVAPTSLTVAAFDRLGLTKREKAKIRIENANKLFGLK